MEGFNFAQSLTALAAATSLQELDRLAENTIDPNWPEWPTCANFYEAARSQGYNVPQPVDRAAGLNEDYVKIVAEHVCGKTLSRLRELLPSGASTETILAELKNVTAEQIRAVGFEAFAAKNDLQPPATPKSTLAIAQTILNQQQQQQQLEQPPAGNKKRAKPANNDEEEEVPAGSDMISTLGTQCVDNPVAVAAAAAAEQRSFDGVMGHLIQEIRHLDQHVLEFKSLLLQGNAISLALQENCPKATFTEICGTDANKYKASAAVVQPLEIFKLVTQKMYRLRHLHPTLDVLKMLKKHAKQIAIAFDALPQEEKDWWRHGQTEPTLCQVHRRFSDHAPLTYVDPDWLLVKQ
jgi:hypothetical protein